MSMRIAEGRWPLLPLVVFSLTLVSAGPRPAWCQLPADRAVPRANYLLAFAPYNAGEYRTALTAFRDAARSGVRTTQGRWIDSICYHTMIGECLYHMGDLSGALEQYDAAMSLLLVHRDWLRRIQWPATIQPALVAAQIPWGPSTRQTQPGRVPDVMSSLQGRADNDLVLQRGGVVAPQFLYQVRVPEVMRSIALSLRRRSELLGPLGAHDELSQQLVTALESNSVPAHHWAAVWSRIHLALAQATLGKTQEATSLLQSSLVVGGQMDHPLTAVALLELGKLALKQNHLPVAATHFFEATFPAAHFGDADDNVLDADVIEESFRYAALVHQLSGPGTVFPPLAPAAAWAHVKDLDRAEAGILLDAAENAAVAGDAKAAGELLAQARGVMGRRDVARGDLGARWNYLMALVHYQTGKQSAANAALKSALEYQRTGSVRRFQIALVQARLASKTISPRVAGLLFDQLLADPTPVDWRTGAFETISMLVDPPMAAMETWLEIAIDRQDLDAAMEIGDRIRRAKFYAQLPFGGRRLALQWILAAPDTLLTDTTRLERQELATRQPDFLELQQKAQSLQHTLAQLPLTTADAQANTQLRQAAQELEKISSQQERMIDQWLLAPVPSELAFPPSPSAQSIRDRLTDGQAMLVFLSTQKRSALVFLSRSEYELRTIDPPLRNRQPIIELLRSVGNYDAITAFPGDRLADKSWQKLVWSLSQQLIKSGNEPWKGVTELVVVPDGPWWHFPFELLPRDGTETGQPLIGSMSIRYLPLASLVNWDTGPLPPLTETAMFAGRLLGRDSQPVVALATEEIKRLDPAVTVLSGETPIPSSLLMPRFNRLIVWDDLGDTRRDPLGWSPARYDANRPGSKLADWLTLPWGAPQQIVLPAFHTAAEDGLKGQANGDELLVATCGLLAAGSRTVLLSRWTTQGRTAVDLVREFVQESAHEPAAAAWQRAVALVRAGELAPQHEPRLRVTSGNTIFPADHPFFWAGYMLVDIGAK